jgi:hypothetical protein
MLLGRAGALAIRARRARGGTGQAAVPVAVPAPAGIR